MGIKYTRPAPQPSVAHHCPPLARHWPATGPPLARHWPTTGPPLAATGLPLARYCPPLPATGLPLACHCPPLPATARHWPATGPPLAATGRHWPTTGPPLVATGRRWSVTELATGPPQPAMVSAGWNSTCFKWHAPHLSHGSVYLGHGWGHEHPTRPHA